jgi:Ni/Fe-hydrogenase subunit HybB-like protein
MTVHVAGRSIQADPRLAWRSVRAETLTFPRSLWLWLGFLSIFLTIGAVSAIRCLFPGDKGTATTPSVEWGLLIVGYVFFAITTSGLCLASSLGTVFGIERFLPLEKRHAILAVLSLVTAFGIIALDLHYPVRLVFGAVLNPSPTSPMWWMGVCYGFYLCVLLVEVWSMFTDHPSIHQVACTAAMCTAVVAPATLGAVFGVVAGRAFWYGIFTPMLMVASAFLSGTALLGIVFYFVHRLRLAAWERAASVAIPSIRLLMTIAMVLVALLITREVVAGLTGDAPGLRAATTALVAGPLALEFWGIRVIAGLVVPFILVVLPRTRTPAGTLAAALLIWLGVFTDRLTFVGAGQIAPVTAISGTVSSPYATYTPSPVEIGIILGAFAFIAFGYTMAERYLDLREAAAHGALSLATLMPWRAAHSVHAAGHAAPAHAGVPDATPSHLAAVALSAEPATGKQMLEPDGAQPDMPAAADAADAPGGADAADAPGGTDAAGPSTAAGLDVPAVGADGAADMPAEHIEWAEASGARAATSSLETFAPSPSPAADPAGDRVAEEAVR